MKPYKSRLQQTLDRFHPTVPWSELLFTLGIEEILVLEQLYVVERGPVSLTQMQHRLAHLNVHPRTIARHCRRLEAAGLLTTISSVDLQINPVVPLEPNVERLVRLWHIREERARQGRFLPRR